MIVTVTMNPAIDKTVDIDRLECGGLNRIKRVCMDAGGKGINVSKTIHHLGGESVAAGFVAGSAGETIEKVLREYGIRTDFVRVSGETRTNMKVVEQDGPVTELNEPGPEVRPEQIRELLAKLEQYASPDTLVVLSGSIPRGVGKDIYAVITEAMHKKGASVLLDADGELFSAALQAKPDIVKPNREELEEYFKTRGACFEEQGQRPEESEADDMFGRIAWMGERLLAQGVGRAVISMGKDGAVFLEDGCRLRAHGLPVKAHSTVGAGDAMVAALALAWERKLPFREAAALGMAASAGAVTTIGTKPPERAVVEELLGKVELEEL